MINNLFVIFDPSTNFLRLNWIIIFSFLILFLPKIFFYTNQEYFIKYSYKNFIKINFKYNINKKLQINYIIIISIFTLIIFCNVMRLIPFIFTAMRHINITLTLSFIPWIIIFLKRIKNFKKIIIHIVPANTPNSLIPFIVIIETIRILIRPFTLAIRLTANIISGHILIALLSNILDYNSMTIIPISLILNLLITLELAVSLIQAYVFTILISIYINEIN